MSMPLYRLARSIKLPAAQKALLIALCDRHNDNSGLCFPSYERLALDTGYERSTVSRNLKKLRDRGFISWKTLRRSGQFGFNVYTIDRVALRHAAENHVAHNDNTELHSIPPPSSTAPLKPLNNPNEPKGSALKQAKNDLNQVHTSNGPPRTPEQFLSLSQSARLHYALNHPDLMRELKKQGLDWDRFG